MHRIHPDLRRAGRSGVTARIDDSTGKRPFWKIEGLGNDFVLIEGPSPADPRAWARRICDRRLGVGADGVLVVDPVRDGVLGLTIWNADGSEASMCGNGVRCVAAYWRNQSPDAHGSLVLETRAGRRCVRVVSWFGREGRFEVEMGVPDWSPEALGLQGRDMASLIEHPLQVGDRVWTVTALSMGNPHVVVFVDDLVEVDLVTWGPIFEHHPLFLDRTNVEFVQVVGPARLEVLVHERGVGPTLACGTGACASLVAAVRTGRAARQADVVLPGGALDITWTEGGQVLMTGPARLVYEGYWPDGLVPGSL